MKWLLLAVLVAGAAILILRLVFPLPDVSTRPHEAALPPDTQGRIGRAFADQIAAHPGQTGVVALGNGHDALASRLTLADLAETSIDAQYYIWHDDTSGLLLLDALHRAAQRGVRVRLLLDDNGIPGLDPLLATLNAQENFQIRLFNPSTVRSPKYLGYAIDFFRMNRRMHNKSMIVDGSAAIIGGRNIGDEYFQIGNAFYLDMDAVAVGQVVPETSAVFDAYWNAASVIELERVVGGAGDIAAFEARTAALRETDEARELLDVVESSACAAVEGRVAHEWTHVQLVADDPAKGQGIATEDQLMISRLAQILGGIETRLDLVSAYFVPSRRGTDVFSDLARRGIEVNILTNALNTTDVLLVHAGYTKYRRDLLQAGVKLYELKLRGAQSGKQIFPMGISGASLHAKTFAVDHRRVFIGSFNFDPRSVDLNCEMGFLIDSPKMAAQVSTAFDNTIPLVSYQPALTPEANMVWLETLPEGRTEIYQREPGATWLQQIAIAVIGILPVEWLL
ncbi:phospholipase [Paracoccus sp. MKU1]|nr:phospholipase [Paracoccus sp. MKU1]